MMINTDNIKQKNRELCERFPFLIPSNRWSGIRITEADKGGFFPGKPDVIPEYDYEYTELDSMPDGWRVAFGEQMCQEIMDELVANRMVDDYRITQIKEKYGCYDEQTEVLTLDGWKYFKDVTYNDKFATLDNDGETLIYQSATDIIHEQYDGPMYHLENRGVNLLVTPNHKLYVAKGSYYYHKHNNEKVLYPFELTYPATYFGCDKRFKKGCVWNGSNNYGDVFEIPGYDHTSYMKINDCMRTCHYPSITVDMIAWLKFLGFYVAEGYTNLRHGNGTEISIAYNPNDEEELVCSLIRDIGFIPRQTQSRCKRIYNTVLAHWLIDNCGHLAQNKKVPDFIKDLPPDLIKIFLEYLFIGDGHKTNTYNVLTTVSRQLCDDVCELLLKAGYAFSYFTREHRNNKSDNSFHKNYTSYEINLLKLTEIEIDNSKHAKGFIEQWDDYHGMVHCVTVPSHVVYVRRGGKGVWCGNSLRWYDNGFTKHGYEIIRKYEELSARTCICCGAPATYVTREWIMPVCFNCKDNVGYISDPIKEVVNGREKSD